MRNAMDGAASRRYGLIPLALAVLPALAVATSGISALTVGGAALLAMAGTSLLFSLVYKFVQPRIRGIAYILFAATLASMIQMILTVLQPRIASSLGLYLPLTSIACALTGFLDVFDEDHELEDSLVRASARGAVYLVVLTLTGCFREVLGAGTVFGVSLSEGFQPMRMLVTAPGGLMLAGLILALVRVIAPKRAKGGEDA